MTVTILITRPEPEAGRFAEKLREDHGRGVTVLCAPLMRIEWTGALPPLGGDETLIFTSRHGVAGFCRLTARRDFPCYGVGEATARAARDEGLPAVACGGTAQALLQRIAQDGAGGPFLHPRGTHVAADIAEGLRQAGHEIREAIVYDQTEQPLSDAAQAVLHDTGPVILPLMSPRSARLFFAQVKAPKAPLLIAAISQNTARMVPQDAAHMLKVAPTPEARAMRDVLHRLVKSAKRLEGEKRPQ